VDGMLRNQWTTCSGFGGRLAPDSLADMDRITHNGSMRKIADDYAHEQAKAKETVANSAQVNFSQAFDVLLREIITILS